MNCVLCAFEVQRIMFPTFAMILKRFMTAATNAGLQQMLAWKQSRLAAKADWLLAQLATKAVSWPAFDLQNQPMSWFVVTIKPSPRGQEGVPMSGEKQWSRGQHHLVVNKWWSR